MAEYTKIETARAIICDFCNQLYSDEPCEPADCDWLRMLEEDAADVAPVVRCRDCIYTRKLYGRLVCKYGTCSGCILREDFFCANGVTRKDGDRDALD